MEEGGELGVKIGVSTHAREHTRRYEFHEGVTSAFIIVNSVPIIDSYSLLLQDSWRNMNICICIYLFI